ncbi:MAG: hypothetical protein M0Z96_09420 [Actinomycetota bacterium]|nr:hypothetical protein [Actinomycetota bacterium]
MGEEPEDSKARPNQPGDITVAAGGMQSRQLAVSSQPAKVMPKRIFYFELGYILLLMAFFAVYATWPWARHAVPPDFGPLPLGVIWFGSVGGVVAGFRGIYFYNNQWDSSYDYWHYTRPIFGAVTGAIGSLIYWVSLHLGGTNAVKVDRDTFYVVAFVLGFSDKAFIELLKNVTNEIIKPGQKQTSSSEASGKKNSSLLTPQGG